MTTFDRMMAKGIADVLEYRAQSSDHAVMQGLQVNLKSTRYGADSVSVTLEVTRAGEDPGKRDFERAAHLVGLVPEDYGRTLMLNGSEFSIAGLNLGRPKFPIDIKRTRDGKMFKFTESGARAKLGRT